MKDPRFAKFIVFINALVPLALLAWDWSWGQLGADPVNYAIRTTGLLALIFLCLSLSVTPARLISGSNWPSNFRRMLGVFAFFYASVHFLVFFGFDRGLNVVKTVKYIFGNPFIFFGAAALLMMAPLAATSTNASIKRLGAARWKQLHRLAYVAGISAVIHYLLFAKVLQPQPIIFAVAIALLLGYRIAVKQFPNLRRKQTPKKVMPLTASTSSN